MRKWITPRNSSIVLTTLTIILLLSFGSWQQQSTVSAGEKTQQNIFSGSGCGKRPGIPAGRSQNQSIISSSLTRFYRIHIPASYQTKVQYPLVLSFHGHGSSDNVQEQLTGLSRLADQKGFIVAYPQGTIGLDLRTGWNTGPWNYPHVNDIRFTTDLIDHLEATLCINSAHIYASGFSNGGGMTNILACKLSDRIAAFAIVSGGMHPVDGGCHPDEPTALIEFHGTADRTVPYKGNPANDNEPPIKQWLAGWVGRDDCKSQPIQFYKQARVIGESWPGCKDNVQIEHYLIAGGRHTWPRTGNVFDLDGQVINATDVIWQFFTEQKK